MSAKQIIFGFLGFNALVLILIADVLIVMGFCMLFKDFLKRMGLTDD